MLKQRIITAVLLAPILLGAIIYGNYKIFAFVVFVIQTAATFEWLKINKLRNFQAIVNALVLSFFTLYLSHSIDIYSSLSGEIIRQDLMFVFLALYVLVWFMALYWLRNHQWGYQNTSVQLIMKTLVGVIAILLFGFSIYELFDFGNGKWLVLSLFLLVWVADIGAYASGKTMGKNKLAINISPGKTWEGVLGAQVLVAIYALIIAPYVELSWEKSLLILIPVALFSVIGDLTASLGKRQAKVKDSSNLLPGHGGFIDRFDSLIAAAPIYYLLFINL